MKKRTALIIMLSLFFRYQDIRAHNVLVNSLGQSQNPSLIEEQNKQILIAILVALVPVIVAFSFIVFLLYRQKREAHFRQVQLRLELDKSELEKKALRAQVNPHFVFNCLNSIQQYIHKNEPDMAENYLVKFSRLIRLVLENSTYAMVQMEDDLKALELYIQLEQLRLNHSFAYNIDTENVDIENVYIPPLLIQPFVENAIWHGITGLRERGSINIDIFMEGEVLTCIIEDNGKPKEYKSNQGTKSKSMGLDLIRKRLDLLQNLHGTRYDFSIEDRIDKHQHQSGKRVRLTLPYEQ